MGKIIRNVIAYIRGCLLKVFHPLSIGKRVRIMHGASLRFYKRADVHISDNIKIDENAVLAVQGNAFLRVGKNVGIGPNNYIVCHKHIVIGEGTIFGPNVLVYDHDHTFSKEMGVDAHQYTYDDVEIGAHCWIGANTIILKGTHIGDNCVIGAGCVIKGFYPDGSLVIQKRETTIKNLKVDN